MSKHAGEATNPNPFTETPQPELPTLTPEDIALRLVLAALFGIAAGLAYFLTQRKTRAQAASFVATMVLLAILLGMVSMVIGTNIARAFALVGALSIVRFRTVVEDTRDTAFVIFAVVVGMAAGSGAYLVAGVGIPIVGFVAWMLAYWGRSGEKSTPVVQTRPLTTVVVRIGIGIDPTVALTTTFAKHAEGVELVAAVSVRQGTALDLTYSLRLREGAAPLTLVGDLNRTEGVQGVEWKAESKQD